MTDTPDDDVSDHPLMRREIVTYMTAVPPGSRRPKWLAFLSDGDGAYLPVYFKGAERAEVIAKAEAWRLEQARKTIALYRNRAAARVKRKAA